MPFAGIVSSLTSQKAACICSRNPLPAEQPAPGADVAVLQHSGLSIDTT